MAIKMEEYLPYFSMIGAYDNAVLLYLFRRDL